MTSQLTRAACALLLFLSAQAGLISAEPSATQAQVDATRRLYLQALQKGDFAAADRYDKEAKSLEARMGTGAGIAPALPASAPAASFFSAPPGSATSAPAASSTFFSPPAFSGTTVAAPAFTPAPASSAPKSFAPSSTPKASGFTPAGSSTSPSSTAGPSAASPFTAPASAPRATVSAFNLTTEEPRPADVPPAVMELRAAQAELSRLEEFRMAESLTTRRGATAPVEAPRASFVPQPSMATTFTSPFTPSVNLAGAPDDLRRKLDDVTRRKAELQSEAERLSKDSADWESRYNAAKAELARLEAESKSRDRLLTIRDEITRLDSDATRLMQDIEAGRADQDRRAREVLSRSTPPSASATFRSDRPMVPAFATGAPVEPERKGPPKFLAAANMRGSSGAGAAEGNIVRTGRSSGDSVALQRDLERLQDRKETIVRELDEVQLKFQYAERELTMAARTGQQADIDRITREKGSLDNRYTTAIAEMKRLDAEIQSKVSAIKGSMGGSDPDMVNPGDTLQIIVAEDDSFNAIFKVKPDGSIVLPRVGKAAVGGKSITEAETAIKTLLEETQLTKATVTAEFKGKVTSDPLPSSDQTVIIYLAGEFITPGPLKIPEGVSPTLITTIIRSGGITPSGDLTRVKLLRIENAQGAVEEINVAAILSGNIPPTDIALNPGDIIMIPALAPVVYVTGNVNKPGTLRLFQDETLTAYSAILRAGGFSRFANLKKCSVVRDLGNGEKVQMPLNVKEIQRGMAPDIVLQGKDVVLVPESFFSF